MFYSYLVCLLYSFLILKTQMAELMTLITYLKTLFIPVLLVVLCYFVQYKRGKQSFNEDHSISRFLRTSGTIIAIIFKQPFPHVITLCQRFCYFFHFRMKLPICFDMSAVVALVYPREASDPHIINLCVTCSKL